MTKRYGINVAAFHIRISVSEKFSTLQARLHNKATCATLGHFRKSFGHARIPVLQHMTFTLFLAKVQPSFLMRYHIIALLAATSMASAQTEYEITTTEWETKTYLAHRDIVAQAEIGQFYGQHLPMAYRAIAGAGLVPGPATGLYWSLDDETGKFDLAAAVPFTGDAPDTLPAGFEVVEVPESTALSVDYYGPYDNLPEPHEAFDVYMSAEEMEPAFLVVEEYITDPTAEPDSSKWLTRIYYLFSN